MCQQYYTIYDWCSCEQMAGNALCSSNIDHDCPGVSIETAHMYCFCNWHATKGWKTEHQIMKRQRKHQKKLQKRGSLSEKSLVPKNWFSSLRSRRLSWTPSILRSFNRTVFLSRHRHSFIWISLISFRLVALLYRALAFGNRSGFDWDIIYARRWLDGLKASLYLFHIVLGVLWWFHFSFWRPKVVVLLISLVSGMKRLGIAHVCPFV